MTDQLSSVRKVKINALYQDEDETHALPPHFFDQLRKVDEVLIEHKVQLPLHVVNICILDILSGTKMSQSALFYPRVIYALLVHLNTCT